MQHIILSWKFLTKENVNKYLPSHSSDTDSKDFMKHYKEYTKEPYSILVNNTTSSSDNPLWFTKNLFITMSISEKIKTINNKIQQKKAQYNLDRQTVKISALS